MSPVCQITVSITLFNKAPASSSPSHANSSFGGRSSHARLPLPLRSFHMQHCGHRNAHGELTVIYSAEFSSRYQIEVLRRLW